MWQELDASDISDFPKLTLEELTSLTLGVYQLKQAESYSMEHQDKDGLYQVFTHKDSADVLRVKIQSRHTSSKVYTLWLQYHTAGVNGWYCQCKVGARVVGCCAHIASVVWYLAYHRFQETRAKKYSATFGTHLLDAATESEEEGWSSENEDS